MVTDLLEDLATMRYASRDVERASCDWPDLRRAILAYGGIGASRDWPRDWVPGDLYRADGKAPDLVAAEALYPAPWGDTGDDAAMLEYLRKSYAQWQGMQAGQARSVTHRQVKPAAIPVRKPGTRSYADLVAELQRKHGADVPLTGLLPQYVAAYETGERVTIQRDGREYRGTIGATRGPRPRFVLLLSIDL